MHNGEDKFVEWLRQRLTPDRRRVPIGIGDDMAVIRPRQSLVAVTADMLLEGRHFDSKVHSYEQIGRKAIACSLSDCAAMACQPTAATVSIAVPRRLKLESLQSLYEGMATIANEYGCEIVGGDTTSWDGRMAIDVTMLAEPMAARGPVTRSEAVVGDHLYVSGPLGGSLQGHHLTFAPRLDLASVLAHQPGLHAMMDISDGLATDLNRLCVASGVSAELDANCLDAVISAAARSAADADGTPALDHALGDGEDFELLIAGCEKLGREVRGLLPIGRMVEVARNQSPRIYIAGAKNRRRELVPAGFDHLAG